MTSTLARLVCRILVVCMAALPFQAQAVLVGTGDAAAARTTVNAFIDRAEVAARLQSLGVSPQAAKERVAGLTDAEAASLAARIDQLPAGAWAGAGLGLILVFAFLLWRFVYSDEAQAAAKEPAKKEPAKKQ
jgi:hypothetical protein